MEGGHDSACFLRTPEDVVCSTRSWGGLRSPVSPIGGAAWTRAFLTAYADRYVPEVLVAGPADAPSGVLPLVRSRRRPWGVETLGVAELHEVTDALLGEPSGAHALAEALVRRRLPVRLRRLPAGSALVPALHRAAPRSSLLVMRPTMGTPVLDLDATWVEPESHFSSRRRQDFRAARRRLAVLGEPELAVEEPRTRAEAHGLLEEFIAVEAAGWKTAAGTSLAVQPRMCAFFREFCTLAAEEGILRFGTLRVDGRLAAGQLATEHDGRLSLFKIGYDEHFARSSPGNLLMLHTVAWSARRGLHSFELLGAVEPWTQLWTTSVRECVELHVYPARPSGVVAGAANAVDLARRASQRRHDRRKTGS